MKINLAILNPQQKALEHYSRWLMRLIGPILLLYFLWKSDIGTITSSLSHVQLVPLLLSLVLYPLFIAVKAVRWNVLIHELDMQAPPLRVSMALYMIGLFLGGTTPGQSGDFIKAWYLRDRGQPLAAALFSVLVDRLFDFLVMALLVPLGIIVFLHILAPALQIAASLMALCIVIVSFLLIGQPSREWILLQLTRLLPARMLKLAAPWQAQLAELNLRASSLRKIILLSIISAAVTIVRTYLLLLALHLYAIPVLAVIAATALLAILQALPISIAGVGTRDIVLITLLGYYGYHQELAVSLSLLILLIQIEHIIIGFLVSLRYPLGSKAMPGTPRGSPEVQEHGA